MMQWYVTWASALVSSHVVKLQLSFKSGLPGERGRVGDLGAERCSTNRPTPKAWHTSANVSFTSPLMSHLHGVIGGHETTEEISGLKFLSIFCLNFPRVFCRSNVLAQYLQIQALSQANNKLCELRCRPLLGGFSHLRQIQDFMM